MAINDHHPDTSTLVNYSRLDHQEDDDDHRHHLVANDEFDRTGLAADPDLEGMAIAPKVTFNLQSSQKRVANTQPPITIIITSIVIITIVIVKNITITKIVQIWKVCGLASLAGDLHHLRRHHSLLSWVASLQNTVRISI